MIERNVLKEENGAFGSKSVKYFRTKFKPYKIKYFTMEGVYMCIKFVYCGRIISTGREQSFTPGGEPPLVPVPHPGVSIRD